MKEERQKNKEDTEKTTKNPGAKELESCPEPLVSLTQALLVWSDGHLFKNLAQFGQHILHKEGIHVTLTKHPHPGSQDDLGGPV